MYHKGYYLIGIKDNDVVTHDGQHDKPEGVGQAIHLFRTLGFSKSNVKYGQLHLPEDMPSKAEFHSYILNNLDKMTEINETDKGIDKESVNLMQKVLRGRKL